MTKTSSTTSATSYWMKLSDIVPNRWNPNRQDRFMFEKEVASLRRFGPVVPVVVRIPGTGSPSAVGPRRSSGQGRAPSATGRASASPGPSTKRELIDGEHRWKAAKQLGFTELPVWDLGAVDDATAKQLTIVLNETKGSADPEALAELLRDIGTSIDVTDLLEVMPFPPERMADLLDLAPLEWGDVTEMKKEPARAREDAWVERTYRMPRSAAMVLDEALEKASEGDPLEPWQALERLAADFLGG